MANLQPRITEHTRESSNTIETRTHVVRQVVFFLMFVSSFLMNIHLAHAGMRPLVTCGWSLQDDDNSGGDPLLSAAHR